MEAADAIAYVGMVAISALMIAQLPGSINDIRNVLQNQQLSEETKSIQDLQSLVSAAPGDITITHTPVGNDQSPIQISKTSTQPPIVSNPEKQLATLCERYNILDQCNGVVGKGYCQWNWINHDCFFVPGPTTPDQCRDKQRDVDETGVDCGGNRCVPCQVK